MKLWEIDEEIRNCVDFETGEIIDPEYLDHLEMIRERKVEGVALYIKELMYFCDEITEEVEHLAKRKKAAENAIKGMKNWLVYACEGRKFETPKCKVTFRTTESTCIDDESKIPDEYKEQKISYTISKTAIKDAISNGKTVAGAHIERKTSTTVK